MSAALRLVECRAVLGGERDPLRVVRDGGALGLAKAGPVVWSADKGFA